MSVQAIFSITTNEGSYYQKLLSEHHVEQKQLSAVDQLIRLNKFENSGDTLMLVIIANK